MDAAIPALDSAVAADPAYPQANLWLAQAKSWRHKPAKEWTTALIAADKGRARSTRASSALADALGALVARRLSRRRAGATATLRERDTLDAIAWLGLATCQAYDQAVVRAPASPSGWAFRGSYEAAWRAATRALELAPEAFVALPSDFLATDRAGRVQPLPVRARAGGDQFGAHARAARRHGRVRPLSDRASSGRRSCRQTYDAALRFNRDRMLALLELLTQRMPASPDVFEAMTNLLEARDEIIGTPNGRYSALSALERARALSTERRAAPAPRRGRRATSPQARRLRARQPRRPTPC